MEERQGWARVKYEADVDPSFVNEIASIIGGEKLFGCIQCGTCSGTCPVSHYMDYTPRRIIAMIRAGFKHEALTSITTWICASCYSCAVECPKGIKITDIMYALKRRAIQEEVYPKHFPISVLAREFYKSVMKTGRNNESRLTLRLFLRTNPLRIFKQMLLGARLWSRGRLRFSSDSIKGKRDLRRLLKALEAEKPQMDGKRLEITAKEIL